MGKIETVGIRASKAHPWERRDPARDMLTWRTDMKLPGRLKAVLYVVIVHIYIPSHLILRTYYRPDFVLSTGKDRNNANYLPVTVLF